MIITTVYGFGNVSVSYEQMTYAGIIWFIFAGVCFFFPAGSIVQKQAFIGTFVWLANWVLWLVASASRLWISISALIFGKDTTQEWNILGLHGTQLIGVLAILFMIVMNAVFILASLMVLIMNHGQLAQPITGWQSFIISPNKSFQTPITIISFVVYAVFAYGGWKPSVV